MTGDAGEDTINNTNTSGETLSLALSPQGRVYLTSTREESALSPAIAARIKEAFVEGAAQGLLHLGAVEVKTPLPPTLSYWRDLGRLFMAKLCALPDLEAERKRLSLPCPKDELEELLEGPPPMIGAEYLTQPALEGLWSDIEDVCRQELQTFSGSAQEYLQGKNPIWNSVGRVYFHLAENKRDEETPFAFLATYTTRLSTKAQAKHSPLGQALREYAGAGNKEALLSLLLPVKKAAEKSPFLKELVDSGEIFHPQAFGVPEAHHFLRDIPAFEASGVIVRVPDWWKSRRPPRPQVSVTVGQKPPSKLGLDAILDFSIQLTLDGELLSEEELRALLAAREGLVLLKGKWVEIDRERLEEVLEHFKKIKKAASEGGISFLEGMRLLSGADLGGSLELPEGAKEWSRVIEGDWLKTALEGLRSPASLASLEPGAELKATLRHYQTVGLKWLYSLSQLGLGACLADDMGLGKTIQVLSLLLLLRKQKVKRAPHLLVVPASLIANWKAELDRFTPSLRVFIAHPSYAPSKELTKDVKGRLDSVDVVITTYSSVYRFPWISEAAWDLVVLDEAQAIKNPSAKQTRAVKALKSRVRLALTGTPVENRLSDLWSIFDFVQPGLLGSVKTFGAFSKKLAERETNAYGPLRSLVRPYLLRRLKSDKSILSDLPDKTEVRAFCSLTKAQATLYEEAVHTLKDQLDSLDGMERRGMILAFLMRFKQICNHPSQWLSDGSYAPKDSGKFARLGELCEVLRARQEKVLIFTQFREITSPLEGFLQKIFGRPGLVLHGDTPVKKRMALVEEFQRDQGAPFFVLSLKAGGTGLNLTAASHVIHFDRWWNPAVENQATDRAYRIGQKKNVLVHKFVCRGTIEEKIDSLIEAKQGMSKEILEGGGEILLTEMSNEEILRLVSLDITSATEE